MNHLFLISILLAALGSGLMAGLFFTFSNFAMKAFAALPSGQGNAAMQSINITIINPGFLSVFLGTAVCSVTSVVLAIQNWDRPGACWVLGGAILYLAGCLAVTASFNVPLNDRLATINAEDAASSTLWQEYLAKWQPWNHLRTVATLAATAAFIVGLCKLNAAS